MQPIMSCLLHTVFFMRALGPQVPRKASLDALGLEYPVIDSRELDEVIQQRLEKFVKGVKMGKHVFYLNFTVRSREKHESGWSMRSPPRNVWESWEFKVELREHVPIDSLKKDVQQKMKLIIDLAQKRTQQIPPLAGIEDSKYKCFDFDFDPPTENKDSGLFGGVLNWFGKK